jgi:calcineurin-like phosphoesterase family protein
MSVVYFTSDWHLGHTNVHKWREEKYGIKADTIEELLFDNFTQVVRARDVTWFLGDMILAKTEEEQQYYMSRVAALPGRKYLVLGNHDTDHLAGNISVRKLLEVFDEVYGMVKWKGVWLTHAPIHPAELRGKPNIHGHMHGEILSDYRYINVCPEQTDYRPVQWQNDIKPRIDIVKEDMSRSK